TLDHDIAVAQFGFGDFFAVQEAVVQVAQVARFVGHGDLLGQAGTQGVGTSNDYTVVDTQFQEGVANGSDLGEEVGMRNGNFAVLVAALLLVGYLVFDLDAAGTCFDHALGQQVGGFRVTETGIDVGNDRHDVGFEVVDLVLDLGSLGMVASVTGSVQSGEQQVQFAAVSLTQEGVELFDQVGDGGLLVHRLIRQRAEVGTQGSDHPAGQVEVALVGGLQVLLDRNQLLLTDEAVPAAQGLGVERGVGVVLFHVLAHDVSSVLSDFQTGLEAVLSAHTGDGLGVDSAPAAAELLFQSGYSLDVVLICGHGQSFKKMCWLSTDYPRNACTDAVAAGGSA